MLEINTLSDITVALKTVFILGFSTMFINSVENTNLRHKIAL